MARVEAAASFRIGEQNKFHEYYALLDVKINDKPVYRCIRDKNKGNGLLFLYYHDDGMWISVSADRWASSKEDIVKGVPAFKAAKDDDLRNFVHELCNVRTLSTSLQAPATNDKDKYLCSPSA